MLISRKLRVVQQRGWLFWNQQVRLRGWTTPHYPATLCLRDISILKFPQCSCTNFILNVSISLKNDRSMIKSCNYTEEILKCLYLKN